MNITIVRMLIGILLLMIPALILFRFDRRFLRQSASVLGRLAVTLLVLAGCLYYIFQWDMAWVNILWVLLSSGVATAVYCRKRWQSVPIYISMTVVTFIMGIVVLLLMDVPHLFGASCFLPVMTMLQAEALFVCRRGITTYVLERRTHKELFEYLRGNGAHQLEALRPFLTKAITRAFTPVLQQLLLVGLVFVPSLLCGMLLCGIQPLQAIAFLVLMTAAALSSTMLILVLSIYIYTRIS
ncbi:ABC transporter permease [Prevotella sp. tf2-5]|uniref:ABC transporter permease n=1 Tax=Prevotella sp. tf2-5 TaxID=1761889 RepID=UPI0008F16F58|nr:ABC transporter permease [Prevotella sp. tf2-5]SFO90499.1 ABC-type iron transport system FetAB, permease component [Prevotella sp. tf2-5]